MRKPCANPTPLLTWSRDKQLLALEQERQQLKDRIERLPPHSHKAIGLQVRLQTLTTDILRMRCQP